MADPRPLFEQAINKLSHVLVDDTSVDSVMQLVVAIAVATIDASDAASVSVLRRNGRTFETMTSTSTEVVELDRVQYETGEGPCVAATRESRNVTIDMADPGSEWPTFVTAARDHGVTSVYSAPLSVREDTLGALNLYSHAPDAATRWDPATIATFALSASVVLANATAFAGAAEQNAQLQEALVTRDLIGQAKGVLMLTQHIDADEAFEQLRIRSQRANHKLRDVAAEIVDEATRKP